VNRIASAKYVAGSRGQPCTFRIGGVCTGGGEDTVFAHIRDRHTGRSIKASDISGGDCCAACHRKFDGHDGAPLSADDWLFYALRALQETLENRVARGLLFLTQDVAKARAERPTPQRKPPEQRAKIHNRGFDEGLRRPIPSRPMRSKETAR
jgi:hypothetical protein